MAVLPTCLASLVWFLGQGHNNNNSACHNIFCSNICNVPAISCDDMVVDKYLDLDESNTKFMIRLQPTSTSYIPQLLQSYRTSSMLYSYQTINESARLNLLEHWTHIVRYNMRICFEFNKNCKIIDIAQQHQRQHNFPCITFNIFFVLPCHHVLPLTIWASP